MENAPLRKAIESLTNIPDGKKGYLDAGVTTSGVQAEVGHRFNEHWSTGAFVDKAWRGPWAAGAVVKGSW